MLRARASLHHSAKGSKSSRWSGLIDASAAFCHRLAEKVCLDACRHVVRLTKLCKPWIILWRKINILLHTGHLSLLPGICLPWWQRVHGSTGGYELKGEGNRKSLVGLCKRSFLKMLFHSGHSTSSRQLESEVTVSKSKGTNSAGYLWPANR